MKECFRKDRKGVFWVSLLLLTPLSLCGQDISLKSVTGTYAVRNVTITQAPGRKIEGGTVVIKDGIISAVGKKVPIPAGAQQVVGDSMYLYAGFISGLSHTGVPKPKEEKKEKIKDPGNPPSDRAGIQPQRKVRTMLDPADRSVDDLRKAGFTSAHVVPHGGMLPGQGALILLTGDHPEQMVYRDDVSMYARLKGAQRMYPSTVIGVMAKYRDLYRKAKQGKEYQLLYKRDPQGRVRPGTDVILEAFYPVIDKKMPVIFHAEKVLDIQRVLTLKKELGFSLMLAEVKQGWDVTGKLRSSGSGVFLSLKLPELKEEKQQDSARVITNEEKTTAGIEKEKLEERKKQIILKQYQQPAAFKNSGITFGFSTIGVKPSNLKGNLSKLVDHGMTTDNMLAALTTHPAELLGVSDVMGSIDKGKLANMVITDKPYFTGEAKVKYVFVDGVLYDYSEEKKPEGEDKAEVEVNGIWNYSSETPDGTVTGIIEITGDIGNYKGTISNSYNNETVDISGISVKGSQMTLSYTVNINGNSIKIELDLTIDQDAFDGTMTAGDFGSFEITGQKKPEGN